MRGVGRLFVLVAVIGGGGGAPPPGPTPSPSASGAQPAATAPPTRSAVATPSASPLRRTERFRVPFDFSLPSAPEIGLSIDRPELFALGAEDAGVSVFAPDDGFRGLEDPCAPGSRESPWRPSTMRSASTSRSSTP